MPIKSAMRYALNSFNQPKFRIPTILSTGEDMNPQNLLCFAGRSVNGYKLFGKQFGIILNVSRTPTP